MLTLPTFLLQCCESTFVQCSSHRVFCFLLYIAGVSAHVYVVRHGIHPLRHQDAREIFPKEVQYVLSLVNAFVLIRVSTQHDHYPNSDVSAQCIIVVVPFIVLQFIVFIYCCFAVIIHTTVSWRRRCLHLTRCGTCACSAPCMCGSTSSSNTSPCLRTTAVLRTTSGTTLPRPSLISYP